MKNLLPAVLVVAVLLASCTPKQSGQAVPSTPSAGENTATVAPSGIFDDVQECSLLDNALAADGFPPAKKETAGGNRGCGADKPKFGGIGIVLDDQQGLDDVRGDPAKLYTGDIGGRRSLMDKEGLPGTTGDCVVYIEAAPKARVMINAALSTGSTDEACAFVERISVAIASQLPRE